MKIILSRKGYDDEFGGKPSIILPTGEMISFPIPVTNEKEIGIPTSQLNYKEFNLSLLFDQLKHKEIDLNHHVDPDILDLAGKKPMGAFGQAGAALCHLRNQKVREGDVFLFYGSFKHTYFENHRLYYDKMHTFHAIYGYLKVDQIIEIHSEQETIEPAWLSNHPHFLNRKIGDYQINNAIYIGKEYGYFNFSPRLQLTKPGYCKSYWQLPFFFKDIKMTYNENAQKRLVNNHIEFTSAAKGQEFVFEASEDTEIWLEETLAHKFENTGLTTL